MELPLVITWAAPQSIFILLTTSPQFGLRQMQISLDHTSIGYRSDRTSGPGPP